MAWICNNYQVLPTDESFKRLSWEQAELLYVSNHPEAEENVVNDPDFEGWEGSNAPVDDTVADDEWIEVED